MQTTVVTVSADRITDWDSFHTVFQDVFGFPDFYGRNMNAWIDCMGDLGEATGMAHITVGVGELVALRIDDAADFQRRCPEQFDALIECTAFVNYRRVEMGQQPVLTLMLGGWFRKPL